MPAKIFILGPKEAPIESEFPNFVNTTSRSKDFGRAFSPFLMGPVSLYEEAPCKEAKNVENAWQFSKVYEKHIVDGKPSPEYFEWARRGFENSWAVRYPMGKGIKPKFSYWAGEQLTYIEARKRIYIPKYLEALYNVPEFERLKKLYDNNDCLYLWDFDGYNHHRLGMSYRDVVDNPDRTMGHGFVIAIALEAKVKEIL